MMPRARDAGVGTGHRDPAAHRAAADDRRGAHGERSGRRPVGRLRGFALGEEDVQPRLGLFRAEQLDEAVALARQPLGERQRRRFLDAIDCALFGQTAALGRLRALARGGQRSGVVLRRHLADAPAWFPHERARESDCGVQNVAVRELVDQPDRLGARAVDRVAAQNHGE
jgi:hypothetical protein